MMPVLRDFAHAEDGESLPPCEAVRRTIDPDWLGFFDEHFEAQACVNTADRSEACVRHLQLSNVLIRQIRGLIQEEVAAMNLPTWSSLERLNQEIADLAFEVCERRSSSSVTGSGVQAIGKSVEANAPITDFMHLPSASHVHGVPTQATSEAKSTSHHHRHHARVHSILEALSQRITDLDTTLNKRIAELDAMMRSGDSAKHFEANTVLQSVASSSDIGPYADKLHETPQEDAPLYDQFGQIVGSDGAEETREQHQHCGLSTELFSQVQPDTSGFRRLDAGANELLAQDICYDLHESLWDVLLFCKMGVFSCADSCCITLSALLNMIVQSCFIGLVTSTMLNNDLDDADIITTLKDWRVLYAHNPDFADTFTDESLAKNICHRSFFRMHGASQAALYNDMDDYIQPFLMMPSGGAVCLLSILTWTLTCAQEFQGTFLFLIGTWTPNDASLGFFRQVPYDSSFVAILNKPMSWVNGEMRQKNYQIFITRRRALTMASVVVLPRVVVLVSLFFVGCLFLVRTVQLEDLILNAVALEVIMKADEMLFSAFAPQAAIRMVRKTMPLRVPRLAKSAEHVAPWIKLVVVSATLVLIWAFYLAPMINIMIDSKRVMCDGDREFLAVQLSFGAVVAARIGSVGVDRNDHKYRAIYQRTKLEISNDKQGQLYMHDGAFALEGPNQVLQIKEWRDRTIREIAALDPSHPSFFECDDVEYQMPLLQRFAFRSGIGSFVGVQNFSSCDDVLHLCFNDTSLKGNIARFACPYTCGVNQPLSGLYMDTPDDGGLDRCRRDMIEDLWLMDTCNDTHLVNFSRVPSFRRYAEGFSASWKGVFIRWCTNQNGWINQTHVTVLTNWLWDGVLAYGCDFFSQRVYFPGYDANDPWIDSIDFCDPFAPDLQGRRTVRALCPKSCNCNNLVLQQYQHIIPILPFYVLQTTQCPGECLRQVAGWWPKSGY